MRRARAFRLPRRGKGCASCAPASCTETCPSENPGKAKTFRGPLR
jgi:hypothetical protein